MSSEQGAEFDADIAVVGLAGRFPGARTAAEFWRNLAGGVESVTFFTDDELREAGVPPEALGDPQYVRARAVLDEVDRFDAGFFGYRPAEARIMDPQQRIFLECAWEALEDAGYDPRRYDGAVGVFGGCNFNSYFMQAHTDPEFHGALGGWQAMMGVDKDYLTTRVSYKLNLRGPSAAVQTACSTSLVAVHVACQSLLNGECDMALAGGVGIIVPQTAGYRYQEGGIRSPDGHCRPFDARAQGTVSGSGVGIVVLKRLSAALRDRDHVYAVVRGSAINNDGSLKVSFTAPSVEGQTQVLTEALSLAGVDPGELSLIEGHGTGTPLGDPIEVAALTRVFRTTTRERGFCALGSVKGNIGHLNAAAGVAGLIKAVLALKHRTIPPSLHFQSPNPDTRLEESPFYVPTHARPWERGDGPRRAGVSSLGIGGTNAHVVLQEAPEPAASGPARPWQLLVQSANSPAALERAGANLARHLREHPGTSLADAAYTLQVGRAELPHRRVVVCRDAAGAQAGLEGAAPERAFTGQARGDRPVAFLFPGQGAQQVGMGAELYHTEPVFREHVDRCAALLAPQLGFDLRAVLYPPAGGEAAAAERMGETAVTQPALFVVESALARLWMAWGVRPQALIGHSVGEYTAAWLAEVFTLEDALALVAARGRLMGELPAGSMLAVPLPRAEVEPLLGAELALAAVNAPRACVVSGPTPAVEALRARLEGEGTACRLLRTSHAFHSAMMDPALPAFRRRVAEARPRPPRIPFVSNLTGRWITEAEAVDPAYWTGHLRHTVLFSDGVAELLKEPSWALLEVGPGESLGKMARRHGASAAGRPILASFPPEGGAEPEAAHVAATLGRLWAAGVPVDWAAYHAGAPRSRVPLPTYPFERQSYWLGGRGAAARPALPAAPAAQPSANPQETNHAEESRMNDQQGTGTQSEARADGIRRQLAEMLGKLFGFEPAEADTSATFLELGADSLLLMQASRVMEDRFGMAIPFRVLMGELSSIDRLAAHLDAQLPPDPEPVRAPPALPVAALPAPALSAPATHVAAAPEAAASAVERVVMQQLEVMARQLELIRGGAPAPLPAAPASAAPAPLPAAPASAAPAPLPPAPAPAARAEEPEAFGPFRPVKAGAADELGPTQREYLDGLVARYNARTAGSKELTQTHRLVLADPRTPAGFRPVWKDLVYPIVGQRSAGTRLWDVDGNEYVDFTMGFGVHLLGHSPPPVTEALRAQLDRGIQIGPQSERAGRVAELVSEFTGMERVAFCNSGTEAVMAALRLARTATGRTRVAMFAGSYHGTFDGVLARPRVHAGGREAVPVAPGTPAGMVGDLLVLDYGTPEALEAIRAHGHELAAVLVEPVQSRRPDFQPREFLHELRRITAESGTALVFDEVISGFRMHPAGAQGWFGVRADLAAYGKVLGAGLPIGVVAGSPAYLDGVDGGFWSYGDRSQPVGVQTVFAGTFSKNPLAMAAAEAVLEHLKSQGPSLQEGLSRHTAALVAELEDLFREEEVPFALPRFGSLFRFQRPGRERWLDLLFYHMVEKGVYIWEGRACFVSTAHTADDSRRFVQAAAESIQQMRRGGFLPPRTRRSGFLRVEEKEPAPRSFPLTRPQEAIWAHTRLGGGASLAYNESTAVHLRGPLDAEAMRRAVQGVVDRHEALRTTFAADGSTQTVAPRVTAELRVADIGEAYAERGEAAVEEALAAAGQEPLDLVNGPLFRARLFHLADEHHLLVLELHHIVADGYALGVLFGDLRELYSAAVEGRAHTLPPARQFSEYAAELLEAERSGAADRDRAYWMERLAGAAPLQLPMAAARPATGMADAERATLVMDAGLGRRLKRAAAAMGTTLYTVLSSAWLVVLHRWADQEDVTLGIPSFGRSFGRDDRMVGHCVDVLPLRSRLEGDPTFAAFTAGVHASMMEAYEHQACTYSSLAPSLRSAPGEPPLVSVTFNLEPGGTGGSGAGFAGLHVSRADRPHLFTKFDMGVDVVDAGGELRVSCKYNRHLLDAASMARVLESFRTLLERAADDAARPLSRLPLLEGAEREKMIRAGRGVRGACPQACLHTLFEECARRTPELPAVVAGGREVSYAALDAAADRFARHLRGLGVGLEARVALCLERSPELVVAMLGTLKAGAAYVPLDPDYPAERLAFLLRDSGAGVVATTGALAGRLPAGAARVVRMDEPLPADGAGGEPVPVGPDHLAYVTYTSGSTGTPKGVAVAHRGVVNLVAEFQRMQPVEPGDACAAWSSIGFDVSVYEIFTALCFGGTLHLAAGDARELAPRLPRWLGEAGIRSAYVAPAMVDDLAAYVAAHPGALSLRRLLVGVEPLRETVLAAIARGVEGLVIVNAYGPTETSVVATLYPLPAGDRPERRTPIGRPVQNTSVYVLDAALNPVPVNAPGELYVGGAGVARGYLGRAGLTAGRFVPDPYGGEPGARMYRTGDRVRWLPEGGLEFIGRADHQVKVRGFRVEMGEVEAALARHPEVREAAVAVHGEGAGRRLVAYAVPRPGAAPAPAALRDALRRVLPEHMLPSTCVLLDEMPRTPGGKVDRRALPAPSFAAAKEEYAAPRTPTEEVLAAIWASVLGAERVGIRDSFFELGGHSLLAARILARVGEEFGVEPGMAALFTGPTVAELAGEVEARLIALVEGLPEEEAERLLQVQS